MGIRVHKDLGFGLSDVKCDEKGRVIDPRFTDILNNHWEMEEKFNKENFIKFLEFKITEERMNLFFIKDMINEHWSYYNSLVHKTEYGLDNVLLIVPPEETDEWRRYDNMIDWIEETYKHQQLNHFEVFDRPIYPYENFMDIETGERIYQAHLFYRLLKDEKYNPTEDGLKRLINEVVNIKSSDSDKFWEKSFKNKEEILAAMAPMVPYSVRLFCEWLGIFKDPKTALQLRPMIYVHWG